MAVNEFCNFTRGFDFLKLVCFTSAKKLLDLNSTSLATQIFGHLRLRTLQMIIKGKSQEKMVVFCL